MNQIWDDLDRKVVNLWNYKKDNFNFINVIELYVEY